MSDNSDERQNDGDTIEQAKRRGRQGPDAGSQPGEYADEMRTNRFTPPPEPPRTENDEK